MFHVLVQAEASAYPLHEDSSAEEQLIFALSQGAEHNLMTYEAYDINGYTFYTDDKDMKSDGYQKSGVTMESTTGNDKDRYYGRIEEIWELSYAGEKVPMFHVRWAKSFLKEDWYFTTMVIPEAKSKTAGANITAKMSHGYWLPKWTNASSLLTRQSPVVLS